MQGMPNRRNRRKRLNGEEIWGNNQIKWFNFETQSTDANSQTQEYKGAYKEEKLKPDEAKQVHAFTKWAMN